MNVNGSSLRFKRGQKGAINFTKKELVGRVAY